MILDLTQGFGDFPEYKLFKFPDGSIKFGLKKDIEFRVSTGNVIVVKTTLRSNDDLFVLALVKSLKTKSTLNKILVPVALGVGVFTGYQIAK